MRYLIICTAALLASGLTLFSGFGLGTLLMPVFAIFFPVEVAIAQTALVHFANNLFKVWLFSRRADWHTVLLFGLPAFLASFAGARVLLWLADLAPLYTYLLNGRQFMVHPVKLVLPHARYNHNAVCLADLHVKSGLLCPASPYILPPAAASNCVRMRRIFPLTATRLRSKSACSEKDCPYGPRDGPFFNAGFPRYGALTGASRNRTHARME